MHISFSNLSFVKFFERMYVTLLKCIELRPRTNVAVNTGAISVDPMPEHGGNGGIGGGANSFYSSANGHCGSVSSLRSGVSERSQESFILVLMLFSLAQRIPFTFH